MPVSNICGRSSKFVEGTSAEFPWTATLVYENNIANDSDMVMGHICGGVLINYKYVLTTATCVVGDIIEKYGSL